MISCQKPDLVLRTIVHIILLIGWIAFYINPAYGQELFFKQITEEENLPSNTVYDILQDDKGYIWFATDFGVARYGGKEIDNIDMPDDLKDISVIRMYQDRFHRIWFLNYTGVLSYYEDGKVKIADRVNRLIAPHIVKYIDHIDVDEYGRFWIAPVTGGVFMIDSVGLHPYYPRGFISDQLHFTYSFDRGPGWLAVIGDTSAQQVDWKEENDNDEYFECLHNDFGSYRHLARANGSVYIAVGRNLYQIRNNKVVDSLVFENNIVSLYSDEGRGLWVSEFFNGTFFYEDFQLSGLPERYFGDQTISRVFRDTEGNYWFTSVHEGVFLVHDLDIKIYPIDMHSIRYQVISVTGTVEDILFSTYDQRVMALNKRTGDIRSIDVGRKKNYATDLIVDRDRNLWVASTEFLRYDLSGRPKPPDTVISAYTIKELSDGSILTGSAFIKKYTDGVLDRSMDDEPGVRIHAIEEAKNGMIWVGTRKGLYKLDGKSLKLVDEPPVLSELRILCLEEFNDKLLIGTAAKGLLWLDKNSNMVSGSGIESLDDCSVRAMMAINDSLVFLGTSKGVFVLKNGWRDSTCHLDYHYHYGNGLPSDDVNALWFDGDRMWAGTDRGLCSFSPFKEDPGHSLPKFRIDRVVSGGEVFDPQVPIILEPNQRNIRIEFGGITFQGNSNLNFRYLLSEHDPEIIYTKNEFVSYSNLTPGAYTFYLNAGNIDGSFHSQPLSLSFTIKKHFTDTGWFAILVILSGLIIIGGLGYLIFNFLRYRSIIQRDLILTRHQLLRSQMNPHFLFNALLAVQSFIYKNNPAEAAKYLSSFSKLMRLTLNSSRKEMVTLEKELEFLRNYLDLQQVRFGGKFQYHIDLQKEINPERIAIPPLLAQPFIENAVEHGIRNIDYEGVIHIRYSINNGEIIYEIEDNGVGLYSGEGVSEAEGALREEPLGIKITRERIRLLRRISGKKFNFRIENLRDDRGNSKGTKVSFNIQYTNV